MLPDELAWGASEHRGGFVAPAMTRFCQPVSEKKACVEDEGMGRKEGRKKEWQR